MEITFKDIAPGLRRAIVSEVSERENTYGVYLCIFFTIIEEGELKNYRFSGFVKPVHLRQSRFYRWVTNILGQEPPEKFSIEEMIGKECLVYLCRQKDYYTVTDVFREQYSHSFL
ncbi:MAG: hypothetical protein V1699_01805 [Candidatus Omnitrophota bacterium]